MKDTVLSDNKKSRADTDARRIRNEKRRVSGEAKKYYWKTRERQITRNRERYLSYRKFIWDYKGSHPCVDCKEKDPRCLDFDHVRGEKEMVMGATGGGGITGAWFTFRRERV